MRMIGDWQRYGVNPEPYLENAEKWLSRVANALYRLDKEISEAKEKLGLNVCTAANEAMQMYYVLSAYNNTAYAYDYIGKKWQNIFSYIRNRFLEQQSYYSSAFNAETIQGKQGRSMLVEDFEKTAYRVTWDDIVQKLGFDPYEYSLSQNIFRSVNLAKALLFCVEARLTGALEYNYELKAKYTEKRLTASADGDYSTGTVTINGDFYAKRSTFTSQCHEAMLYGMAKGMYEERNLEVYSLLYHLDTVLSSARSYHDTSSMGYDEECYWTTYASSYGAYPSDREKKMQDAFLACRPEPVPGKNLELEIARIVGEYETVHATRTFYPDGRTTMRDIEKSIFEFINFYAKPLTPTESPGDESSIVEYFILKDTKNYGLNGYYICNFTDLKTIDLDALTN